MKRNARKTVQINIKVTRDFRDRLGLMASRLNCSLTDVLELGLHVVEQRHDLAPDGESKPEPQAAWMIWNPLGRMPTMVHRSIDKAEAEAERLARCNPGQTFILMRSQHGFRVDPTPPPPVTRVETPLPSDEIPF